MSDTVTAQPDFTLHAGRDWGATPAPMAWPDDDPVLKRLAELMRMALFEAGHPEANVYIENGAVWEDAVDDDDVLDRAFTLANQQVEREFPDRLAMAGVWLGEWPA